MFLGFGNFCLYRGSNVYKEDEDSLSEEAEGCDEEDEDEDLQKEDDEDMLPLTNDTPFFYGFFLL